MRKLVNREGQVWAPAKAPEQMFLITRSYIERGRGEARCHEVYDVYCQLSYVVREALLILPIMVRLS